MTLNNSMSITPSPPGQAKGAKFEHGSVLGGKTRDARVSSQWKSTVHYLGFLKEGDPRKMVFDRQCSAPGSTFAFDVKGGEKEAFALLDHLQIMKLAVSLGGTETLISHPASLTHSGVARELREEIGLSEALIRVSIGIENVEDLISDLAQGLEYV